MTRPFDWCVWLNWIHRELSPTSRASKLGKEPKRVLHPACYQQLFGLHPRDFCAKETCSYANRLRRSIRPPRRSMLCESTAFGENQILACAFATGLIPESFQSEPGALTICST